MTIYTIGHSTRSLAEVLDLLRAAGVQLLVDIRTVPRSRRNPEFNRETLPTALAAAGIGYAHLPRLGGFRGRGAGTASPNGGWEHASFRNFADYMLTADFAAGLDELLAMAGSTSAAVMCAEAVPWRCHRSLVADALVVRGVAVRHIVSAGRLQPHRLCAFAAVDGTRITYPRPAAESRPS